MNETYTVKTFAEIPDSAADQGLGDILEARFARDALRCETIGLSLQKLKPGARAPFAHRHEADEEVYVVLAGGGEALVDGELVTLAPMTALRCAPAAVRVFAAGDRGLEWLAFGTHTEGDGEVLGDPWA